MLFISPPSKADKTDDHEGGKHEVEDPGIEPAGRFFTHLLGCFGAHSALRISAAGKRR